MTDSTRAIRWFSRILWLRILINWGFALPAVCFPGALLHFIGQPPDNSHTWLRNTGMLLFLLSAFYIVVADAPLKYRTMSWVAVWASVVAGLFWVWLGFQEATDRFVLFAVVDLILGASLLFLLRASNRSRIEPDEVWRPSLLSRLFAMFFRFVNRFVPWFVLRVPPQLGAFNLLGLRYDLRAKNLHDTSQLDSNVEFRPEPFDPEHRYRFRSPDGAFNDPNDPAMGSAGQRFGRNFALRHAWPNEKTMLTPNPRDVSNALLGRPIEDGKPKFQAVPILNLLAAAWIQFQNHDWFNHSKAPPGSEDDIEVEAALDDPESSFVGGMRVRRTQPDPTRPDGSAGPPTYLNTETHWWDASQVYGSHLDQQKKLRTWSDGKMRLEDDGLLPTDPEWQQRNRVDNMRIDLTGFNQNYWVGLSMLHTLFVREHNAICDELVRHEPCDGVGHKWTDETLFLTARLINSAVIAKIHTVEWTPGILGHPSLKVSMNSNWWGLLGEAFKRRFGRLGDSEALSGIIGSPQEHHAAPFSITEEFTSVYRLHPLIPDEVVVRSVNDGRDLESFDFKNFQGGHTRDVMEQHSFADLFYTFLTANPGAIRLLNFPDALRKFERFDENGNVEKMDLAAIDILRDRERGVRRYNEFRELLRMPKIESFEEMVDQEHFDNECGAGTGKRIVDELRRLYPEGPDSVDLMVGMFAEKFPPEFGFSDTAFRIFILMASRRLKSDYFFTDGYTAENYTEWGLRRIDETGMADVIQRHVPEVADLFPKDANPFAPWKRRS